MQQQEMMKYKRQTDRKIKQQQQVNDHRSKQQQSQMNSLIATLSQLTLGPSKVMVMSAFKKHKDKNDKWYSPPFYSHIGGYKMCLSVSANGHGNGEATHVSVFCHLNRGEYDDQLKWPFRGAITIQLLNQSRDEGHWEVVVPFDDTAGTDVASRVVGEERATTGWGYDFIAHTELNTENKQYLKNDCLKFRISKIVVKSI